MSHPGAAAVFFAVLGALFMLGAMRDLRGHSWAWPWFGITVAAGVVAGALVFARGKVAEDTSARGAWSRTKPWVPWMTGAALLLNVAGPVVGGVSTGLAIGMCVAATVGALRVLVGRHARQV